jgi:hypothetical protein
MMSRTGRLAGKGVHDFTGHDLASGSRICGSGALHRQLDGDLYGTASGASQRLS